MLVAQWRMRVRMRVGFRAIPGRVVIVPMVLIMDVQVFVTQCGMFMRVLVAFREVQPDADRHQGAGQQ